MSQASGRVTIKLDGQAIRSKPGASLQTGGITRTGDMTDQGEFYQSEKWVPSSIQATMPHMTDTDIVKLRAWKNGTATFATDAGHTFTVAKACVTEIGDLSNGEVVITIMGNPVR